MPRMMAKVFMRHSNLVYTRSREVPGKIFAKPSSPGYTIWLSWKFKSWESPDLARLKQWWLPTDQTDLVDNL